jgi:energy-converting hydrogenase Eha subunit F
MLGRCEIEAVLYRPCRLPLSWASVLMLVFVFGMIPDSYSSEEFFSRPGEEAEI